MHLDAMASVDYYSIASLERHGNARYQVTRLGGRLVGFCGSIEPSRGIDSESIHDSINPHHRRFRPAEASASGPSCSSYPWLDGWSDSIKLEDHVLGSSPNLKGLHSYASRVDTAFGRRSLWVRTSATGTG